LKLNGDGSKKAFFNEKLATSRKWREIGLRLLLITNEKWFVNDMKIIDLIDDLKCQFALLWLNGAR